MGSVRVLPAIVIGRASIVQSAIRHGMSVLGFRQAWRVPRCTNVPPANSVMASFPSRISSSAPERTTP